MGYIEVYNELLGATVKLPEEPKRIVSLAPSITETLYVIGAWDRVVGVSFFCDKPAEASSKPRVGGYLNVNYRLLDQLKPDLILATSGIQLKLARELASKGYPVYVLPLPLTVYGILENIVTTSTLVNMVEKGRKVAKSLAEKIARLAAKPALGLRVYYEVDLGEPVTVGAASYIDHGLYIIGVSNVFGNVRKGYFQPEFSKVAELNPDVIIYEPKPLARISLDRIVAVFERRGWGGLKPVREKRIIVLEPNSLAHYGPSFISVLEYLRTRLEEVKP